MLQRKKLCIKKFFLFLTLPIFFLSFHSSFLRNEQEIVQLIFHTSAHLHMDTQEAQEEQRGINLLKDEMHNWSKISSFYKAVWEVKEVFTSRFRIRQIEGEDI